MSTASWLSVDLWYPVLRGGPRPRAVVNLQDARARANVKALWRALGPGERMVLRVPSDAEARACLSGVERLLEPSDQRESFVEFGGGDLVALLPAGRGSAFRASLDLLPRDLPGGRALTALLRIASPFSLSQRFGRPETVVLTRLGAALPQGDLPALPVDGDLAVTVHVRDRSRPVEVRALDRRASARVTLKVGVSSASSDAVRREVETIEALRPRLGNACAALVGHGERDGAAWMALEPVRGRGAAGTLTPAHAAFLTSLSGCGDGLSGYGGAPRPLRECRSYTDGWRHLAAMWRELDEGWYDAHRRLARELERAAGDSPLPVAPTHGRFTPEAIGGGQDSIRVLDWQHFDPEGPALHDLFHFLGSLPEPEASPPGAAAWARLSELLEGEAGRVVRSAPVTAEQLPVLLGLSVLLDSTGAELRARQRVDGVAPEGRLRDTRLELVRRAADVLEGLRPAPWAADGAREDAA